MGSYFRKSLFTRANHLIIPFTAGNDNKQEQSVGLKREMGLLAAINVILGKRLDCLQSILVTTQTFLSPQA